MKGQRTKDYTTKNETLVPQIHTGCPIYMRNHRWADGPRRLGTLAASPFYFSELNILDLWGPCSPSLLLIDGRHRRHLLLDTPFGTASVCFGLQRLAVGRERHECRTPATGKRSTKRILSPRRTFFASLLFIHAVMMVVLRLFWVFQRHATTSAAASSSEQLLLAFAHPWKALGTRRWRRDKPTFWRLSRQIAVRTTCTARSPATRPPWRVRRRTSVGPICSDTSRSTAKGLARRRGRGTLRTPSNYTMGRLCKFASGLGAQLLVQLLEASSTCRNLSVKALLPSFWCADCEKRLEK